MSNYDGNTQLHVKVKLLGDYPVSSYGLLFEIRVL